MWIDPGHCRPLVIADPVASMVRIVHLKPYPEIFLGCFLCFRNLSGDSSSFSVNSDFRWNLVRSILHHRERNYRLVINKRVPMRAMAIIAKVIIEATRRSERLRFCCPK